MKLILPIATALVVGATPLLVHADSFSDDPRPVHSRPSLYERIVAHYGPIGRDVKEEYRDGPCKITREWETDGDYYERIKCRGPRD